MLQYFYFSPECLVIFYAMCHISSKNIPVDRSTGMYDWVKSYLLMAACGTVIKVRTTAVTPTAAPPHLSLNRKASALPSAQLDPLSVFVFRHCSDALRTGDGGF